MKLYPKKLDSLEMLKREKIRLRYERRQTDLTDLNPLAEIGRSKVSNAAKEGLAATAMQLLSSKSNLEMAWTVAKPLMKLFRKKKSKKQALREAITHRGQQRPSWLKKLAVEVATGYITGKAVILGARYIKLMVKRRKQRHSS